MKRRDFFVSMGGAVALATATRLVSMSASVPTFALGAVELEPIPM